MLDLRSQLITPSPQQGAPVWLAVHEDGIGVLDYKSMVSYKGIDLGMNGRDMPPPILWKYPVSLGYGRFRADLY